MRDSITFYRLGDAKQGLFRPEGVESPTPIPLGQQKALLVVMPKTEEAVGKEFITAPEERDVSWSELSRGETSPQDIIWVQGWPHAVSTHWYRHERSGGSVADGAVFQALSVVLG